MSYQATSNLFYGIVLTRDELAAHLDLNPKDDVFEEMESIASRQGFQIIQFGNMVMGDENLGISIHNFEVDEGYMEVPPEKMVIAQKSLAKLKAFMVEHDIKEFLGWHLTAKYG